MDQNQEIFEKIVEDKAFGALVRGVDDEEGVCEVAEINIEVTP